LREAPFWDLDTSTGTPAVPARSTSLGRGVLEHSEDSTPAIPLRTGTVRRPVAAVVESKTARTKVRAVRFLPRSVSD